MLLTQLFNFSEILNKLMLMNRLLPMNLIEHKKKCSENKLLILLSLLIKIKLLVMKPPPIENTLNKKSPSPTNTSYGLTKEEMISTNRKKLTENTDVLPTWCSLKPSRNTTKPSKSLDSLRKILLVLLTKLKDKLILLKLKILPPSFLLILTYSTWVPWRPSTNSHKMLEVLKMLMPKPLNGMPRLTITIDKPYKYKEWELVLMTEMLVTN